MKTNQHAATPMTTSDIAAHVYSLYFCLIEVI